MKLAIVADCHIGNLTRYASPTGSGLTTRDIDAVNVLEHALSVAASEEVDAFVIAGDLFHKDMPTPAVMSAVMQLLVHYNRRVVIVVGNHDRTTGMEDAILPVGALLNVDRIAIVSCVLDPQHGYEGACVMAPAGDEETLVEGLAQMTGTTVVAHHGIWDNDTPAFLKNTKGALYLDDVRQIMRHTGASLYVSGDWHQHKMWSVPEGTVVQIGALCPTGFADASPAVGDDPYGSVLIVDTFNASVRRTVIPHPVFLGKDVEPTTAHAMNPYPVYSRSGSASGAIKVVAAGGRKTQAALTLRVASAEATSREAIMNAIAMHLMTAPASPEVQNAGLQALLECA